MRILVINGPNLCALGKREPEIYGNLTLDKINSNLKDRLKGTADLDFITTNYEGEIISAILDSVEKYQGIIINPGAYAHYSIAIMDSIRSVSIPVVEVHLTNINGRENFRKNMVTAEACIGCISGFGEFSYYLGALAIINNLQGK
ncbi:type II 3-dehydroquinate dehydratase [Clostridium polynesiense]|uniref:type II 3-dehydroquinate dehydratase n=1 Tax=Clostridium polynesiense TaxID=1325933 RepID=UPI00058ED621|nr:type II 3-dehydroquinate dehydratase [Clostridium polynesiense]